MNCQLIRLCNVHVDRYILCKIKWKPQNLEKEKAIPVKHSLVHPFLIFSNGISTSPSHKNIFKEIKDIVHTPTESYSQKSDKVFNS